MLQVDRKQKQQKQMSQNQAQHQHVVTMLQAAVAVAVADAAMQHVSDKIRQIIACAKIAIDAAPATATLVDDGLLVMNIVVVAAVKFVLTPSLNCW